MLAKLTPVRLAALLGSLVLALVAPACGGPGEAASSPDGRGGSSTLTLVAYSTPREAYEEIIARFAETPEGQGVGFEQSYASSGEQSRAVEAGLPADIVALSLAPDVTRLVEAGLVDGNWAEDAHKGMVTESVVVLIVRKGNPKDVKGWDDLVRDDVEVINPNPFTSGGARWNVMAAYGAQLERGKTKAEAVEYLRDVFANIPVQDKSARESLATFTGGKGDILLGYENEAIFAQQAGEEIEYIVPDETILIENPVAVTTESENPGKAQAFVDFLRTPEAQEVFVSKGYRPVVEGVAEGKYPTPVSLFTIEKFGGWDRVMDEFFDREDGILAEIERDLGVPIE